MREAEAHGVSTVVVDAADGIDSTVAAIEDLFAEALAEGPRAETRGERQALLREANESIVSQVRGYFSWRSASGDAEVVVREFLCECGDRDCLASVQATVGEAAAGRVLAPDHA